MATEFDQTDDDEEVEEFSYVGLYAGTVVTNADPRELGRVQVKIPGLIEPSSAWALPAGTISGGSAGRGFYDPPDRGSDVLIQFLEGDIDQPVYWGGFWGEPDSGRETPGQAGTLGASVRPLVKVYETARYQMIWDHRSGAEQMVFRDKVTGDQVGLTPAGINIKSAGVVNVSATGDVNVNGDNVELNGPGIGVGRIGDSVQVTIPAGVFHITNPAGTPPTIPSPVPIIVTGAITGGSGTVKAGS